jgi:hypothetical protein
MAAIEMQALAARVRIVVEGGVDALGTSSGTLS